MRHSAFPVAIRCGNPIKRQRTPLELINSVDYTNSSGKRNKLCIYKSFFDLTCALAHSLTCSCAVRIHPSPLAVLQLFTRALEAENVGGDGVVLVHPTCGPTQADDIPGDVR